MPIETIRPTIFSGDLNAFFTLKNEQLTQKDQQIDGLNLGYNTNEAPEIITRNRKQLFDEYHIDHRWIAFANQVHSNRVKVVTDGGTFAETDGLITQVPGLALAIQVADCAAVLIADDSAKTVAAVHAGWRGAAGNIVRRAMEKMLQIGVAAENCKAFISPCISLKNFEVGREVADQFQPEYVDERNYEKPHINLKDFLKDQLIRCGLQKNRIEVHLGCTIENDKYYSYRRQGRNSGRMMAVIQIKSNSV